MDLSIIKVAVALHIIGSELRGLNFIKCDRRANLSRQTVANNLTFGIFGVNCFVLKPRPGPADSIYCFARRQSKVR